MKALLLPSLLLPPFLLSVLLLGCSSVEVQLKPGSPPSPPQPVSERVASASETQATSSPSPSSEPPEDVEEDPRTSETFTELIESATEHLSVALQESVQVSQDLRKAENLTREGLPTLRLLEFILKPRKEMGRREELRRELSPVDFETLNVQSSKLKSSFSGGLGNLHTSRQSFDSFLGVALPLAYERVSENDPQGAIDLGSHEVIEANILNIGIGIDAALVDFAEAFEAGRHLQELFLKTRRFRRLAEETQVVVEACSPGGEPVSLLSSSRASLVTILEGALAACDFVQLAAIELEKGG